MPVGRKGSVMWFSAGSGYMELPWVGVGWGGVEWIRFGGWMDGLGWDALGGYSVIGLTLCALTLL